MSRYADTDTSSSQTGDWIMGAARRNPEALLLLAAGCVLLMRSGGSSSSRASTGGRYRESDGTYRSAAARVSRATESASDYASDIKDRVSSTAGTYANKASAYAGDVKDRISDTASSYADTVSDFASDARRNVSETTERFRRQAQSTLQSSMDRILKEQPLAVALVGLAAGAGIAAVFPSTAIEGRTLGDAREALTDAASKAGENLMGAAGKAGERLKSAAAERGLSADGLKDVASDVAETFTNAAKGRSNDLGSATMVPESPAGTEFGRSDPTRTSSTTLASELGSSSAKRASELGSSSTTPPSGPGPRSNR
jgi:hypothetical protein